jgi:hypothetical protein
VYCPDISHAAPKRNFRIGPKTKFSDGDRWLPSPQITRKKASWPRWLTFSNRSHVNYHRRLDRGAGKPEAETTLHFSPAVHAPPPR